MNNMNPRDLVRDPREQPEEELTPIEKTDDTSQRTRLVTCLLLVPSDTAVKSEEDMVSAEWSQLRQVRSDTEFEPLLDVAEAARLLRMHPRTLRTKARERTIPAVQVGRRWRFRASTLNDWLVKLAG
jgi:excisionase family DNA binding protein